MPEAAQDIHDSKDLGNQVGALLEQMQAGTQHLASEVAAPVSPPAPALRATAQPAGTVAAEAPPATAAVESDLAHAVAAMVQEQAAPPAAPPSAAPAPASAAARPAPPPPPPKEPADAAPSIDSLDAELAGLADQMIAGEFADEAAVMKEEVAPAVEAPAPAAALPVSPAPKPPVPKEPADAVTLPAPAPKAAPAALPKPAPRPAPERGPSGLLRAVASLSAPLSSKPHLREMLGYFALFNGFLALCVWVYVLFVRSSTPVEPAPLPPAQHAQESSEHSASPEKSEGHQASSKAKKPPKKAPKKAKPSHAEASHE